MPDQYPATVCVGPGSIGSDGPPQPAAVVAASRISLLVRFKAPPKDHPFLPKLNLWTCLDDSLPLMSVSLSHTERGIGHGQTQACCTCQKERGKVRHEFLDPQGIREEIRQEPLGYSGRRGDSEGARSRGPVLQGNANAGLLSFKDHFSDRAGLYAIYRPEYPKELFEFIAGLSRFRRAALDCATGNGQAARGLAAHFDRVVATDASPEQIARAEARPGIEYRVARADASGLPDQSVDLVTVAQGLHWLEPDAFFAEAKRVLAPGGAVAVWCYGDPVLDTPELQAILHGFNRGTVEGYWLPERDLVLEGYATVPFPFDEVATPSFTLSRECTLAELVGYVRTWSATARYVAECGTAGVERLESELASQWGDPSTRHRVDSPLFLRAGH